MERSVIVRVRDGLHARPATRFVKLAKGFSSDIQILANGKAASAKSSVRLMLLSIKENDEITLKVEGTDAADAIDALTTYLGNPEAGLDDEDGEPSEHASHAIVNTPSSVGVSHKSAVSTSVAEGHGMKAIGASAGYGLGVCFAFFKDPITVERRHLSENDITAEAALFEHAVLELQHALKAKRDVGTLSSADRGIVTALIETVSDEMLVTETLTMIRSGLDAVSSVHDVTTRIARDFAAMEDPYLQARAEDVRAIGRHLCLGLLGKTDPDLSAVPEGAIVVAHDLSALDLASAPLSRLGGLVCAEGAATSHVAIIARTHAIPAVLGLGDAVFSLRDAKMIAVDGHKGVVYPNPDASVQTMISDALSEAAREKAALTAFASFVPMKKDGTVIEVAANLGSLNEIDAAVSAGAMGVGLFRTELLFMQHRTLPDEERQYQTYATLASAFPSHSVIIRTLDIGGDKPVAGIQFPREDNPFLGWRGIRMCLDRPDLFKTQLRALLRAAVLGNIKVMLPMVSSLHEIERTRLLIAESAEELRKEGTAFAEFPLGIMIETPAAVMMALEFAKHVAFFSIGTNDLTQYVMAADRMNQSLSALCQVDNPAVMRAIALTAKAGVEAGIMVGMCGEAAARRDLLKAFVEMGLTEFSMSPAAIPSVKKTLSELSL